MIKQKRNTTVESAAPCRPKELTHHGQLQSPVQINTGVSAAIDAITISFFAMLNLKRGIKWRSAYRIKFHTQNNRFL